ncbi:MAG: cytochrome P450 [Myxococcales bacterium]|nr:cytochrome P450 [Myxococcales bacterium]
MKRPPGPSSPALWQTAQWMRHPIEFLTDCAARYGDLFRFQMAGFGTVVVIANPDLIREVFLGSPDVFLGGQSNNMLRPFVGDHSLLVLDGDPHARQRKLLAPAFHGERMLAYGQAMLDLAQAAIDRFALSRPFALHPEMQAITLRVILRTIFGIGDGTATSGQTVAEEQAQSEHLFRLLQTGVELASNPLLIFPILQHELFGLSPWGRFKRLARELDDLLRAEIDRRRQRNEYQGRSDILSMMMQATDEQGHAMSFAELRDELVTMLVAGHETTANALGWTVALLLQHPALYDELAQDIESARDAQGALDPEKLAKLPLLDATIRESLRLRPIAPLVARLLAKPLQLAGYDIPAGWVVAPAISLVHQRAATYRDPLRFDPHRFLREKLPNNEWLPFGGGNRRCIGAAFATYEMKMVLSALLSRTRMRLAPGYTPRTIRRGVVLTASEGVPVIVEERRAAVRLDHSEGIRKRVIATGPC